MALSNIASTLSNYLPNRQTFSNMASSGLRYGAPMIGNALGNYVGGSSGEAIKGLGNIFGNLYSDKGQPNINSAFNQFGQQAGTAATNGIGNTLRGAFGNDLGNLAMKTRLQDFGPTLGEAAGRNMFGSMLPGSAGEFMGRMGAGAGSRLGSVAQSVANRFIPDYYSQSTPTQIGGMAGNAAKNMAYNRLSPETRNVADFQEMPFAGGDSYARGGYALGGGAMSSAMSPMEMNHPYNFYNTSRNPGFGAPSMSPGYAEGGYAMGGDAYDQSYYSPNAGGEANISNMPRYRPSLSELAEMMPTGY